MLLVRMLNSGQRGQKEPLLKNAERKIALQLFLLEEHDSILAEVLYNSSEQW